MTHQEHPKDTSRTDWKTEFYCDTQDLLTSAPVQALRQYSHHHRVSRYDHILLVAQISYRIART